MQYSSLKINSNVVKNSIKKVRTIMYTNFFVKMSEFLKFFFAWIHTCGFEMIGWAIKDYRRNRMSDAVLQLACGIVIILVVLFIDLLIIYGIYRLFRRISIILKTKEVKRYKVVGIIKSKDYQSSYISSVYTGKMLLPVYHDEEYNVCVEFDGVTKVFNSEKMFGQYERGDSILLILVEKLGKNNIVIERTLELPE